MFMKIKTVFPIFLNKIYLVDIRKFQNSRIDKNAQTRNININHIDAVFLNKNDDWTSYSFWRYSAIKNYFPVFLYFLINVVLVR